MSTGAVTLVAGPLLGKLADAIGKYKVFAIGSRGGRRARRPLLQPRA